MGRWTTVLWLVLWTGAAVAQETSGSIQGKVTDAAGKGVPGSNVVVEGSELSGSAGSITDEGGEYRIDGLPTGTYQVTVTHVGFKPEVRKEIQIKAGAVRQLDFVLEFRIIFLDQSVVSASRRQEKMLEAPASVSVVETEEIQDNPTLSVVEHIKDLPAVDVVQCGLVQNVAVVRGFNNIFSGALLPLTDNRIARIPSLGANVYHFIPTTNDDVERIEVVLGPGAALYGPNCTSGVMHIITHSPFTSAGTRASVGLGERSLRLGSVRHAGVVSGKLGYKVSAQYYTGTDWKYTDPAEIRERDYDIERQVAELRLDYRPTEELTAIFSTGFNTGGYIELTGLGAAQVEDWTYNYAQARLLYRDWFAQVFRNWSDAGDTFLLRSGEDIVDRSSLTVFQIQHTANLGNRQRFTYGFDALLTRTDTDSTVTGQNEDDDAVDEFGGYVQSESALTDQLNLVLALRYDDHNRIEDAELSPRAALVFKPRETQTWRLTYNRAFSTPSSNTMFLELLSSPDPFGLAPNFAPVFQSMGLDFHSIDVRAQGTYRKGFDEGFTFQRDPDGRPLYRSPFTPLIAAQLMQLGVNPGDPGYSIGADGYLAMDDPVATGVLWGIGRQAVLAQFAPSLQQLATGLIAQQLMAAGMGVEEAQAAAQQQAGVLAEALPSIIPEQLTGLENAMLALNLEKVSAGNPNPFDPAFDAFDVPRTKSEITQTFEFGYKGVIGKQWVVSADAYRTTKKGFIGQLKVETPNVFLEPQTLGLALGPEIGAALQAHPELAAGLAGLDAVQLPGVIEGNGDGTPADELTRIFVEGVARIPFGTVSPEQAYDPNAVILAFRNFGEVTVNGLDLSLAYYPNEKLTLTGNYSFVDDNFFENLDGIADVSLNTAKHKFKGGARYLIPKWDLQAGGKLRYAGSFPMHSGVFVGDVDSHITMDANLAYKLPIDPDLMLRVDVTNLLNTRHREFIGGAEIGRLLFAQVSVEF